MASYKITIVKFGSGQNSDGFIDPKRQEEYTDLPTTLALSKSKVRGHKRYLRVMQRLGILGVFDIRDMTCDATASTDASELEMTVHFRNEPMVQLTPGIVSVGEVAILESVATALIETFSTVTEWIDPTKTASVNDEGAGVSAIRKGYETASLDVGGLATTTALAKAKITIQTL